MKKLKNKLLLIADVIFSVFILPSAILLKRVRVIGVHRLPICKKILLMVGVFPIRNHYYEPLFDTRHMAKPLDANRNLPGIDWNIAEQLNLLQEFIFSEELINIPSSKNNDYEFYFNNESFVSGDADFFYNMIRLKKPKRIFEVGCGNSTLMAIKAITKNKEEDSNYTCKHVCIEPYEVPWLEKAGVCVIREKIEDVEMNLFQELEENDIFFIDSSHVIRPQGDVLFEYLEILPVLKKGVIVHIHDIFSPRDYLKEWITDNVWLWNEQYLLEAFLTSNGDWKIIGAVNFLHHQYYARLKEKCSYLTPEREPGSFYMQKIN